MGEFVGDKNLTVIKMHGTTIKIKCKVPGGLKQVGAIMRYFNCIF